MLLFKQSISLNVIIIINLNINSYNCNTLFLKKIKIIYSIFFLKLIIKMEALK